MAHRVDQRSVSKCSVDQISSSVLKEETRKVFIQTDHAHLVCDVVQHQLQIIR